MIIEFSTISEILKSGIFSAFEVFQQEIRGFRCFKFPCRKFHSRKFCHWKFHHRKFASWHFRRVKFRRVIFRRRNTRRMKFSTQNISGELNIAVGNISPSEHLFMHFCPIKLRSFFAQVIKNTVLCWYILYIQFEIYI